MATFTVNGKSVTVEKNQKLIRFLRDELHLTSVKDGCSEGACGTCHVLIDGKPTKACIPQTDKLEGKAILTVEGLSDWEKQVYTFAFGEAGAVQCGFCIPGMVISAKGLLDVNPDPTREEAAFAIRNNICRCTGYVKIIDGILLAAKIFREGKLPAPSADDWQMGSRVHRLDVEEKVLGYGQYPDDIYVDSMCYGGAVRSQYARARVLSIDTSEAEALPGVICVATQKDIPGKVNVGHLKKDQPTLIGVGELVHYLGDSVALVCAVDQETVEAAKKLVKVEYEVLPAVHNPTEAAAPGAPLVFDEEESNVQAYKHVSRGDAETAIKNSKYVLTEHFSTPWTEHAFLEPECCVALPLDNGGVKLLTTDQSAHTTMHECASMLGVDYDHCQVQNCLVGGGFGGKEDMSVQHHASLLAYLTGRPVKVSLSRQESIAVHPKRHAMEMDFTTACDENGILYKERGVGIVDHKEMLCGITNKSGMRGTLADAVKGADVFIGVSVGGALKPEMARTMARDAIVFAMANPVPEITPEEARAAGVRVMGTGRSDYPNQINNVLAFPGVFKGALSVRARDINSAMKVAAAHAIADLVSDEERNEDYIIPGAFDARVAQAVADAVARAARESGVARL